MTTQTINTPGYDDGTEVQYHGDYSRDARPAINVKMHGLPWQTQTVRELAARVGDKATEDYLERATEILSNDWWNDAAAKASALGLGGIESEGRMGGWLVFADGRDPQDMVTLDTQPDDDDDPEGADAWDREIAERREWLAAYSQMREWCDETIAAMPERLGAKAAELERETRVAKVAIYPEGYKLEDEPQTEDRPVLATCLWCGQRLVDGKAESGYTGEGPDYMTPDGDFGCSNSPDTGENGTGGHTPNVVTTADGHTVRVVVERGQYAIGDRARLEVIGHPEGDDAGKASA